MGSANTPLSQAFFYNPSYQLLMRPKSFQELIRMNWLGGNFACIGLDPDIERFPTCIAMRIQNQSDVFDAIITFLREIVRATKDIVPFYKPNSAFFEGIWNGDVILAQVIEMIREEAPDALIILDYKRADIDNTNLGYVKRAFDILGVDAVTVHPYLGRQALAPFLKRTDKGMFVLCRTSNPGAAEFQDHGKGTDAGPLYLKVARNVAHEWNEHGNCGLVVGATYPGELYEVRQNTGKIPILIPGVGKQSEGKADALEMAVTAGMDEYGEGIVVNSSRDILYASRDEDFAAAARAKALELHQGINRFLAPRRDAVAANAAARATA